MGVLLVGALLLGLYIRGLIFANSHMHSMLQISVGFQYQSLVSVSTGHRQFLHTESLLHLGISTLLSKNWCLRLSGRVVRIPLLLWLAMLGAYWDGGMLDG